MIFECKSQRGFTLIEMIIVMVITGIIGAIVAVFIRAPVKGYVDSARRAEMTDIADTALRRLARDIRSAVPNSVRLDATSQAIEFLPTKTGGRYRAEETTPPGSLCGGTANGDALSFDATDTCFEIIGPAIDFATGDAIVIGSTQSDGSVAYDQTATGGLRQYTGTLGAQNIVKFTGTIFPESAELSSRRFQVVEGAQQAVTYACVPSTLGTYASDDGGLSLMRYWKYGYLSGASTAPGGIGAMLADKVSSCMIDYGAVNVNFGLVTITLTIKRGGESVSMYQEIHVNNIP